MLFVLKYGGNAMAAGGGDDPVLDEVAALATRGDRIVLVHGGGPQIDAELHAKAIDEDRIRGLRVTGAGDARRGRVRALRERQQGAGARPRRARRARRRASRARTVTCSAPGVPGRSTGSTWGTSARSPASIRRRSARCSTAGSWWSVAPLGLDVDRGGALNCNADTAAGAIAGALGADAYVVLTNVAGVRRDVGDPDSVIARLTVAEAEALLDDGTFTDGMIPKMRAAISAVRTGARACRRRRGRVRFDRGGAPRASGTELVP